MKIKKLKKAMKSETPYNDTYALIPESKREEFNRFASYFGLTEENIKSILENEKRKVGHID